MRERLFSVDAGRDREESRDIRTFEFLGAWQLSRMTIGMNHGARSLSTQYSREVTIPGCGTGYRPSASATSGAGESMVNLSVFGDISKSQLSIWSNVTSRPVWAAMRPMLETRLASTPR